MQLLQFFLIGVSLAMDAFAICLCQGMVSQKDKISLGIKLGVTFGIFQTLMPYIGFYIGNIFSSKVSTYGNIIAFIILVLIGINMIRESGEDGDENISLGLKSLFVLGVATSIDALAIGLSFSIEGIKNIYTPAMIIGIVTFFICFSGTYLGKKVGSILQNKAHRFGGAILILIGIKTLAENFI